MVKKIVKSKVVSEKPVYSSFDQGYRPKCYDRTPFECVWCDLKFDSIRKIEVHVRTSHKYNCNHCVKELKTWQQFLYHAEDCEHAQRDLIFITRENDAHIDLMITNNKIEKLCATSDV